MAERDPNAGPVVLVEREGAILIVTLNRPEKRNCINAEMMCRLFDAWQELNDDDDQPLTGALIGGNVGLVTTALLAPSWNMTRNRARVISIAGVIGGLGGLGLDLLVLPDDDKTAVAIPLATSLVGLGLGVWATRNAGVEFAQADEAPSSLSGALFKMDEGDFRVGFPMPTPTFLRRDLPSGGTALEPAASFTLFAARF